MMSGLMEGQEKMSKSSPNSAIFMQDTVSDVKEKIRISFCPEKIIENNPILDYTKHLIFQAKSSLLIERLPKNGGNV